jgi:tripartite-type tricarboxylate transporter receptor subunit TctC
MGRMMSFNPHEENRMFRLTSGHLSPRLPRRAILAAGAAVLALGLIGPRGPAAAQDGLVRMVVPMAAGGPADFVARTISEKLREKLGASVIIENKPGANGALGGMAVAAAPPDGKTLLFATSGLLTITPTLEQKSNFNPATDLTPITNVVVNGTALVVRADHPANNIAELVAISKKGPKPVTLGSAGFGNILHLYVEVLKDATNTDILHVPYRGVAPAMTDALAGVIDGLFADLPASLPQIKSGKMKALGMVGEARSKAAPNIPTIAEQGYPGVTGASWFGLFGPPKMDPKVASEVAAKVAEVLRDPEIVAKFEAVGATPTPTTPADFAKRIEQDRAHWARVIKEHNIHLEK